jgi:hypothetical protein
MMILTFMASTIALVALWPGPGPRRPDLVQAGPQVTHVDRLAQNIERLENFRRLQMRHRLELGGFVLTIVFIVCVGYRVGRRLG